MLGIHVAEDEPPRSESVRAPALRLHKTIVRASAYAIAEPLRQLVLVGRRPAAVDVEPLVRVPDGPRLVHAHKSGSRPDCLTRHRCHGRWRALISPHPRWAAVGHTESPQRAPRVSAEAVSISES